MERRKLQECPGHQRKTTLLETGFHRRNTEKERLERHLELQKSLWRFKNCGNKGFPCPINLPRSSCLNSCLQTWPTLSYLGQHLGQGGYLHYCWDQRHLAEWKELGRCGSFAVSQVGGSDLSELLFLSPQMQAKISTLQTCWVEKKKKKWNQSYKMPNSAYSVKKGCYYQGT